MGGCRPHEGSTQEQPSLHMLGTLPAPACSMAASAAGAAGTGRAAGASTNATDSRQRVCNSVWLLQQQGEVAGLAGAVAAGTARGSGCVQQAWCAAEGLSDQVGGSTAAVCAAGLQPVNQVTQPAMQRGHSISVSQTGGQKRLSSRQLPAAKRCIAACTRNPTKSLSNASSMNKHPLPNPFLPVRVASPVRQVSRLAQAGPPQLPVAPLQHLAQPRGGHTAAVCWGRTQQHIQQAS